MAFTKLVLAIIVSLLLLQTVSSTDHLTEFSFVQGAVAEIQFPQFRCNEIEILRYENLPVETQKGISETGEQSQAEKAQAQKTESAFDFITATKGSQEISSTNSTESSYKETGSTPQFNVKEDTKFFYKEVPFKVLGVTRKSCPASFPIKVTAQAGYYYIPLRLYSYEKTAEPDIRYVGVEILPDSQSNTTTTQSGEQQVQRESEHQNLFYMQFVTLLLSLFTALLWVFAVFFRRRRHEK